MKRFQVTLVKGAMKTPPTSKSRLGSKSGKVSFRFDGSVRGTLQRHEA